MNYPFYTDKPAAPPSHPVKLPTSCQGEQTDPEAYRPGAELVDAVNVALLLGKPLLLTGKPGTGKTQLAYSLAYQMGLPTLKFETKSTSQARDLFYIYDALGRFHAAQAKNLGEEELEQRRKSVDYLTYNALGLAILLANEREKVEAYLPSDFEENVKDALGSAYDLHKPLRSVVLIDEIDKAPRDFPNDILNEIENLYFRIPELNNHKIEAPPNLSPILVLTSNSEKPLPDAFLRRCIYYDIPFPKQERLTEIIEARLQTKAKYNSDFIATALDLFFKLRKGGLEKLSTAELLDWLMALRKIYKEAENPLTENSDSVSRTLSSLIKNKDDQETAQNILNI
jgi:MoxR-like ATPase